MSYLVLKTVTVKNVDGDTHTHLPGSVLSDFEVSDYVRDKVTAGDAHFRSLFDSLTDDQAHRHRVRATTAEGPRFRDGHEVAPPFDDYVGLHPSEIIDRMSKATNKDVVDRIKAYEKAGMNRSLIVDYTAPMEREPWPGYDEMTMRQISDKLELLPTEDDLQHVIQYEAVHRKRPAILQFERESEVELPDEESIAPATDAGAGVTV